MIERGIGFRTSGTSFDAKCPSCGKNTKMATGAMESHVMLFAVQCGACMAVFEGEDADAVRGIPIAATSSTTSP